MVVRGCEMPRLDMKKQFHVSFLLFMSISVSNKSLSGRLFPKVSLWRLKLSGVGQSKILVGPSGQKGVNIEYSIEM